MKDCLKEYLVDVPVAIQAFIRPEMLKKQWEVICQARPSTIIIRSDGPRKDVPTDNKKIKESREIVENIDWKCDVHRLYFDENQGLYGMIELSDKYIWERFDRCIFLEDDQIPSVSFFKYCEYLLEKYKDDKRVYCIHGVNLCGTWDRVNSDYFFARVPASSGIAMWRRSYLQQDRELKYKYDSYISNLMYKKTPWYLNKQFKKFAQSGTFANHPPASEFYVRYAEICQNQLVIVPKFNLINNIGVGEGSTHTANNLKTLPKALQKLYNMRVHEMNFPMKDAEFIIPDINFERKREQQLGVSSRIQYILRLINRCVRLIIFGESNRLFNGIVKNIHHSVEK